MTTARRRALLAVVILLLSAGCGADRDATLPRDQVSALLLKLTGAPLPAGAVDVYGRTVSVFTTVVDIRFSCDEAALSEFVSKSSVLSGKLERGKHSVRNSMSDAAWWKPDALQEVSGLETVKQLSKSSTANLLLMSGRESGNRKVTVYLAAVLE